MSLPLMALLECAANVVLRNLALISHVRGQDRGGADGQIVTRTRCSVFVVWIKDEGRQPGSYFVESGLEFSIGDQR
jgi:hypothetical protein